MTKKQILILLVILICAGLCIGAAVTSSPYTGAGWNTAAPNDEALSGNTYLEVQDLRKGVELRINREHLTLASSSAGGWHLNGSAVCYEGTTAEPNLPDDSAALSNIARDRGRLWIDDNYDPPVARRWAGAAYEMIAAHLQHATALEFLLESTENANTDGSMDSKIRAVGYKDAAGDCDLAHIVFSHDGTSDDQKGKVELKVNDGDDDNAPSKTVLALGSDELAEFSGAATIAGTLDVTGNIDPTTYETTNGGFLDEDAMGSDAADKVASQQSIRAYVDNQNLSHAGQIKAWVVFDGTDASPITPKDSYGITSVAWTVAGKYRITWSTAFSGAFYSCTVTSAATTAQINAMATTYVDIWTLNASHAAAASGLVCVMAIGAQ